MFTRFLLRFVMASQFLFAVGCQLKSNRTSHPEANKDAEAVKDESGNENAAGRIDPKYSLAKDRAYLQELREAVPAKQQQRNDERALIAEWFATGRFTPGQVREKFDVLLRKKREQFNKDLGRLRDQFNKDERKQRTEFLNNLSDQRKAFLQQKSSRERRNEFFNEQDETRRSFLADLKDKRDEFEVDVRQKRKDFEDYLKERNDEFQAELKAYKSGL